MNSCEFYIHVLLAVMVASAVNIAKATVFRAV